MFAFGKPFQPILMFVGKTNSLPYGFSFRVGSCLNDKHYTSRLERLVRYKHTSSLQTFIKYG